MNSEFFANNRKRFLEKLEENSVAFFHSGFAPVKSNDQDMHPLIGTFIISPVLTSRTYGW